MVQFNVDKYKDAYRITNTGAVNIAVSTLKKQDDCTTFLQVKDTFNVAPGTTSTLNLLHDGEYRVDLLDDNSEVADIRLLHYLSLEKNIVADIQYILCDCVDDPDCVDCKSEHSLKHLSTMLKILSYQRITHPRHAAFLETVFEPLKCSVNELTLTMVLSEQTTGTSDPMELIKKILSFYYLAFYHSEFKSVSVEEQEYINTKYNYTAISSCIDAELLTDAQTKIDNMGTFTVINGAYVNKAPEVGDNTIEKDNRTTTPLTLEMFTSQTTPPYSDPENDPVDALRIDSIDGNNQGKFQYDNVDVTVGLIIPAAHIVAGRFTHIGPDADAVLNDIITFSLRDTGSMTWVS